MGAAARGRDESVTVPAATFFSPATGLVITSGSVEVIAGKSVEWELQLTSSGGPSLAADAQNVTIGSVNLGFRPRTYNAPFTGWPGAGALQGLTANTGPMTVRWSDAARTSPGMVIGGSWPI